MMSKRILTAVTLAAVTIHVLLGCCWHHAHESDLDSFTSTASLIANCQCHDHSSHSEPADGHDHHSGHESCDSVDCFFYSAENSDLDLFVASAFCLPVTGDVCFASLLDSVRRTRGTELSVGSFQLPEPLHALKQVWLI